MLDISKALLLDIDDVAREVGSRSRVYELLGLEEFKAVKVGASTKILGETYRDYVRRLPLAQFARPRGRSKSAAGNAAA